MGRRRWLGLGLGLKGRSRTRRVEHRNSAVFGGGERKRKASRKWNARGRGPALIISLLEQQLFRTVYRRGSNQNSISRNILLLLLLLLLLVVQDPYFTFRDTVGGVGHTADMRIWTANLACIERLVGPS